MEDDKYVPSETVVSTDELEETRKILEDAQAAAKAVRNYSFESLFFIVFISTNTCTVRLSCSLKFIRPEKSLM